MIYFDNAATTKVKPKAVLDAVIQAMTEFGNAGRGAHCASMDASRVIFDTRKKLSDLFNGDGATQVAFTINSTQALNTAIKGFLTEHDHIITSVLEHNSVLRPVYELKMKGADVTYIGCDEYGSLRYEEFEKSLKPNTKAVVITAASNLTGNTVDLKKVSEFTKKHNLLLIVDASQTGGIYNMDMKELSIDVLCFTGHKGLLGPQGTGGLVVRKGIQINPLLTGGSGVQTFLKTHPVEMPTALEAGTLNSHGISGLNAALDYLNETGIDNIRKKELELMERFYTGVKDIPGVKIYGDFRPGVKRCAIVSLNIRDYDSGEVSDALALNYDIAVRSGAHCAPLMHEALGTVNQGAVRFSFSHMNTVEEVDIAINAVKEIAEEE
ncbi:MAG: aminotransferase class V-fold PLP-dependent enzyme [Clostridia bacterium]|nr:aminotransferase class V-fold PLP-dependent enzyme [Clostridia bacterium]